MICVVFDNASWHNVSRNTQDASADARYYSGYGAAHGCENYTMPAGEYYALAANLGYEDVPYREPYFDPKCLNPIEVREGAALAEGDVPCITHPPYIVRAEYGRIHVFGDSMKSFYNTNKDEGRPVCKYLKQFCFWNLNDRSRRGAKVLDITNQVQTFFHEWSAQDLTGTVVPKKGCPVPWVNEVPRQEELPNARTGEFMSVCRTLIQDYESDAEGAAPAGPRPRPVFMDSDVAFFFVTQRRVPQDTGQRQGDERLDH